MTHFILHLVLCELVVNVGEEMALLNSSSYIRDAQKIPELHPGDLLMFGNIDFSCWLTN